MLKLPFIDWIWTTRGYVVLDPPRSPASTFARLDPLLKTSGTEYEVDGNTLTYRKENPAAQDRLATFTKGTLKVVEEKGQSRLRYRLTSPALLLVFLAPLLFLAFAQATIVISELERPTEAEKAAAKAKKEKDAEKDKEPQQLNVIDQMLGAPAPETLEEKKQREKQEGEEEEEGTHSPKAAYVFAGIFAALFCFGRWLEPWLVRKRFRKALNQSAEPELTDRGQEPEAQFHS
ncbi:hypothetical protein [Altericroceibacterium indicum]|uniref:hypothetical protein n=1 Tax=Altericroceibacterium indicum TaxID=374177 RepID=UPI0031B61367